jgi:hypothetical protein
MASRDKVLVEIEFALSSSFKDFEDAVQQFAAKAEGSIGAIVTRNKTDYSASELPVLSPDEFLAQLESQAE